MKVQGELLAVTLATMLVKVFERLDLLPLLKKVVHACPDLDTELK